MKKTFKLSNFQTFNSSRGVTLFIAVTITAVLLFISFVVINIAVKSTQFAGIARDSQLAFSAADAGAECALYWDVSIEPSPFDLVAPGSINCNSQPRSTGNHTVQLSTGSVQSIVGGPEADAYGNTSIFQLDFNNGTCAIVSVTKNPPNSTLIQSKGYNTCDTSNSRRVERGVEVSY